MSELGPIFEETANRLFGDHVTPKILEEAEAGVWPSQLWDAVQKADLSNALSLDSGVSWEDAFRIVRSAGAFRTPVPIVESLAAGWLLAQSNLASASGPATIVEWGAAKNASAAIDGDKLSISASFDRVPWGAKAKTLVVIVPVAGENYVTELDVIDAQVSTGGNIARESRDKLVFENVAARRFAPTELAQDAVLHLGALMRSAQIAGALAWALSTTTEYARDRVQFGKPIAAFQAIQQQLAIFATEAAAADHAAHVAFRAMDTGFAPFEIACAKARAGEAATIATGIAHQVHGAIGFTREHALHTATRRLWSWRADFGSDGYWSTRIGRVVLADDGQALWRRVTA
jgi:acyl-CoA dehydrogenase